MERRASDTSPEAEAMLIEAIRRAPVWKRLALVEGLIEATRAVALADLRRADPAASPEQLRRRLAARILAPEQARAAYGADDAT